MQKAKVICLILALVLSSVGTVMVAQNLNGDSPAVVLPTDAVNTYLDKPSEGDPSSNDAITNLYIAAGELKRSGGFVGTTYGQTVSVGLAQEVSNKRTVVNGNVFKEMATVGVVKNAYQLYLYGGNYLYRKPDKINSASDIKWANSAQKFTKDDFLGKFGHCSNELTGYILNNETVLEGALEKQEDGLYTYRYVLDKVKAPAYMLYEMRANSNMKGFSTFIKAEIIVTMDANWQVKTLRTDCEYNVPMFGGVKCTEDITETFTEIGYQGDLPEKAFFEQFFNADAVTPVEPTDDALTVLMNIFDPYISGGKLNVELNAAYKDTTVLTGLVSAKIDIEHLENIAVDVKLGEELYASYEQGKLFVTYQDFKGSTTVDGIMGLVNALMPNGIGGGTSGSESDEEDDLLANASYEVKDGVCAVKLPLSLGDTVLNVNFYANVNGDKYEFTSAAATLGDITVNILPVTEVSVPERSGEYPEILGLTDLVKNGMISAEVNAFGVSADVLFDLATNSLYAHAGDVELTMQQQTLFASLGELKFKLALADINDLLTLVKTYINLDNAVQMPTLTLDGVLSALNAIKATSDGDGVVFSLELDGLTANVKLVTGVNGWNLQEIAVTFGENTVTLCPSDAARQIPDVNADEYADVTDVAETFLTPVVNLIKAESYGAEFNASVVLDNKTYEINGSFVYDRLGNIAVKAAAFDAGKMLVKADVTVAKGAVYLNVNGVKAAFKLPENNGGSGSMDIAKAVGAIKGANGTVDKLIESVLTVVDNVKNFDITDLDLKELVKSFNFENKTIDMTVNAQAFGLGEFGVKLSASRGNLTASLSGLTLSDIVMNVGATVKPNVKDVAIPNAEDYVTELELNVMGLTVCAKLDLYNMTAVAYTTVLNTQLAVLYSDGTAYVNYGALKAKLNVADIDRLVAVVSQFIPNDSNETLGALGGMNVNAADILSGLGFVTSDNGYAVTLTFGGIYAEVKFAADGGDVTLENLSVQIGDVKLAAALASGNEYPQVDTNGCVDLVAAAETFAPAIRDILTTNGYGADFNADVTVNGNTYNVMGDFVYDRFGNIAVKAAVSNAGKTLVKADVTVANGAVYLNVNGVKAAFKLPENNGGSGSMDIAKAVGAIKGVNGTVDKLIEKVLSIIETAKAVDVSELNFGEIIKSFSCENGAIDMLVDGGVINVGAFGINVAVNNGKLSAALRDLVIADITLNASVGLTDATDVAVPNAEDYVTELKLNVADLTVCAKLDLYNMTAVAYTTLLDNQLAILYQDGAVYVTYGSVKAKLNVADIDRLIAVINQFIPGSTAGLFDGFSNGVNAADILSGLGFVTSDNGYAVTLTFGGISAEVEFAVDGGDVTLKNVSVQVGDVTLTGALANGNTYPVIIPDGGFVNLADVAETFAGEIKNLIDAQGYEVNFNGKVSFDGYAYGVNANVIYNGGLYVKAGLSYNGVKILDAEIWLVDNVLYLKSDKLTLAVQIGNDGNSNTGAKSLADTLNGLKGYNAYVDVLIDFVNQTVAKFSSGSINYVNLIDSLEFDGSELTLAVNGGQLGLSNFVVKLNALDGAGVSVSGLRYGSIALDVDNAGVKATDVAVVRPDGDFTTNLSVKIDASNTLDVNLDLINGVYKFRLKNLNACYADNKIRINYDDKILVQGDINRIKELVQRIDDLVHEFSGADKGSAGVDLTALFGEINVKDIVKSLSIASVNGGVQVGLTLMGMNATARFADGKLDKIVVPVSLIDKSLEITAANKVTYYEFSDTDEYVAIEQILDDYMPTIEKLVATNCWKFAFTQDSFVTIDKTVYTLNAGSYFEFYYNETNKDNTQFRAKLSLSAPKGNGQNTVYSIDVALKKDGNGVNRIYVSYNNKLRASVSLDAVMGCADEFTKLQSAIPQIGELIGKIFAAKDEIEGKEIDYSTILKDVSYVDKVFNMVINGNVLLKSLGDITVNAGLHGNGFILNNLELKYDNIQVKLQGMTVEASATVNDKPYSEVDKAEDYTAVQDIAAYDSASYHINLDSIKQLLSSVNFTATDGVKDEATGKMLRSFNIAGNVHLSVPLFGDVDIKMFAKVDINENEKTFFTIKLVRGNIGSVNTTESIVYADKGGDSYLYFDGEQERITVIRNSWTTKEVVYLETEKYCTECGSKLNAFGTCFSKPVKHGSKYIGERQVEKSKKVFDYYAKDYAAENLTPTEFSADLMTHILEMVNLSDGIEKQITKQQDSNEILIENLIKDYKYSEINESMTLNDNSQVQLSGKFTVDLALSQISSALGDISLGIKHQDNGCLRNVSGSLKLVSLIDATLDLNLMSPNYGDATRIVQNVGNSEIAYW